MKILAVADRVTDILLVPVLGSAALADIDLIVSCGDLPPEFLARLKARYDVPLFYVLGNHDLRYDMADEYLDICRRLWDAFPRDAIIADRERGVFVDIDKVKRVEFAGRYYRCEAYPVIECSPQGRPLIFQAGASGRGIRFAVFGHEFAGAGGLAGGSRGH